MTKPNSDSELRLAIEFHLPDSPELPPTRIQPTNMPVYLDEKITGNHVEGKYAEKVPQSVFMHTANGVPRAKHRIFFGTAGTTNDDTATPGRRLRKHLRETAPPFKQWDRRDATLDQATLSHCSGRSPYGLPPWQVGRLTPRTCAAVRGPRAQCTVFNEDAARFLGLVMWSGACTAHIAGVFLPL
jgi:hypothetical protein